MLPQYQLIAIQILELQSFQYFTLSTGGWALNFMQQRHIE